MEQATLYPCFGPTSGNGQQDTFLAVAHRKAWCRYGLQQLAPRSGRFVTGPMSGDDVAGGTSDEANE